MPAPIAPAPTATPKVCPRPCCRSTRSLHAERLLDRIQRLERLVRGDDSSLTRLAASDASKAGRDALTHWLTAAGLKSVDRLGNLFGIWRGADAEDLAPVMIDSHIDTVIEAGI
jgi:beta-ureidopropionase / N-carbamoyl-L-amino-acid hydrolase